MKCWRYLGAKRLAKTPSANQGTNRNQVMFISTDVLAVNLQKARPYQKFGSFLFTIVNGSAPARECIPTWLKLLSQAELSSHKGW